MSFIDYYTNAKRFGLAGVMLKGANNMAKWKSGLLYNIVVSVNGKDQGDSESSKLYRKYKQLHLGKTGMKSPAVADSRGNKMQSRRVWTGLYV